MKINYTKETSSENLNNSTGLQIIIEQNNCLIKLLKSLTENLKTQQTELINEIRHTIISTKENQIILKEENPELSSSYSYPYKSVTAKELFEFEPEKQK